MERVAAFVDAGYFWVQISHLLYGQREGRERIVLDARLMRESLLRQIREQFPESSLLRVYWYDGRGPNGQLSAQHRDIACLNDIKMRYGTLNGEGQQKGVDGLLMADMIALAQNRAITAALLVSGDADLTPGVSAVQMLGVRVHRLEMVNQVASSPVLSEEVDVNTVWPASEIESFVSRVRDEGSSEPVTPAVCPAPVQEKATAPVAEAAGNVQGNAAGNDTGKDAGKAVGEAAEAPGKPSASGLSPEETGSAPSLRQIARTFVEELKHEEKQQLRNMIAIPKDYDKRLLFDARTALGRFLEPEETRKLREYVKEAL